MYRWRQAGGEVVSVSRLEYEPASRQAIEYEPEVTHPDKGRRGANSIYVWHLHQIGKQYWESEAERLKIKLDKIIFYFWIGMGKEELCEMGAPIQVMILNQFKKLNVIQ